MHRIITFCLLALCFAPLARPALCQNANLKPLLSGATAPLTLKLGDLNGDWRRISVEIPADSSNVMQMYSLMFSGGTGDFYYTQGQTVTLDGDQFLVAYHVPLPKIDFQALVHSEANNYPKPPKLTAGTILYLTLLNLHTITSLSDIHPFDLQKEVAESNSSEDAKSNQISLTNLLQLGQGFIQYLEENDAKLPSMKNAATVRKAIYSYVGSDNAFIYPVNQQPYLPNTSLSGRSLASFHGPATMVIYYEASPASDGTRGVAYLDGRAKRIPEAQWPQIKLASHIPNTPVPASLPPGDSQ